MLENDLILTRFLDSRGDRITGEIVKKDGDTVTIKSKNFGTVTLKWADVATVKSDQPINVSLADGKTVKANIETRDGRIQLAAPGAPTWSFSSSAHSARQQFWICCIAAASQAVPTNASGNKSNDFRSYFATDAIARFVDCRMFSCERTEGRCLRRGYTSS